MKLFTKEQLTITQAIMETENESEQHLKALKISGADSGSFPPPVPEGEEDKYVRLSYRLKMRPILWKFVPAKKSFIGN